MVKRKTRRTKAKPNLSWRKLFAYFIPVALIAVFLLNQTSGGSVLGQSDEKKSLFSFGQEKKATDSSRPPKKIRVSNFSLSGLCDNNKNGFKSATYTCEDGTTGTLASKCFSPQSAFEKAKKACARKSSGPKPSQTPTPAI